MVSQNSTFVPVLLFGSIISVLISVLNVAGILSREELICRIMEEPNTNILPRKGPLS